MSLSRPLLDCPAMETIELNRTDNGPKSLFTLAMNYIVRNAEKLESLVGFPSLVGEQIFVEVVSCRTFTCKKRLKFRRKIATIFAESYKEELLSALNLTEQLFLINDYLDVLLPMSVSLRKLSLNHCFLGPNHEFIEHISSMTSLQILHLAHNDLQDAAIRKMGLPAKMFGRGPVDLVELDLRENPMLTERIIPYFEPFKKLQRLQLPIERWTQEAVDRLESKYSFFRAEFRESQMTFFQTEGWATILMDIFTLESADRIDTPEHKSSSECFVNVSSKKMYGLFIRRESVEESKKTNCKTDPKPKKRKAAENSIMCSKEQIEKDLFKQYM